MSHKNEPVPFLSLLKKEIELSAPLDSEIVVLRADGKPVADLRVWVDALNMRDQTNDFPGIHHFLPLSRGGIPRWRATNRLDVQKMSVPNGT